jgi:hypothetical protein
MASIVEDLENLEDSAAQELAGHMETIDKWLGDRPFHGRKLSENEQLARYIMGREDPAHWQQLLQEHGPRDVVRYAQRMENMIAKHQGGK